MRCDPRVRYTRTIIKKAFYELLKEKPVNKITVREICERAEINRSTFYKHYLDCYDLLDALKEDALAQFDKLMTSLEGNGAMPALLAVLRALKDNAESFSLFAPGSGSGEFTRQVIQRCYRYFDMHLTVSAGRDRDEAQKEMSYAFLTGGISSVIERWTQNGCKESPVQVAAAIMELCELMTGGLSRK